MSHPDEERAARHGESEPVDELLAAAYSLDGPQANRELYARWAATYEQGFIVDSRYVYHEQVAAVFAEYTRGRLTHSDVVVDVGCGTGLAGAALRQHVDVCVDGLDISPEMLHQASLKHDDDRRVYRHLIEADLTQPLAIENDRYAGALSVGTFTHGHVGPDALAELVRILRPGARAAIGVNAAHFAAEGFDAALARLEHDGHLTDLHLTDLAIYEGTELDDPDLIGRVVLFEVC